MVAELQLDSLPSFVTHREGLTVFTAVKPQAQAASCRAVFISTTHTYMHRHAQTCMHIYIHPTLRERERENFLNKIRNILCIYPHFTNTWKRALKTIVTSPKVS